MTTAEALSRLRSGRSWCEREGFGMNQSARRIPNPFDQTLVGLWIRLHPFTDEYKLVRDFFFFFFLFPRRNKLISAAAGDINIIKAVKFCKWSVDKFAYKCKTQLEQLACGTEAEAEAAIR